MSSKAKAPPPESPPTRRRHRVKVKEHSVVHDDGEGNWLVSYADMMTLLFGFFVILSAFSTPDAGKMEKLKQETSKTMGVKYQNPYQEMTKALADILSESKLSDDVAISETDEGVTIVSKGTLFFDSGSTTLKPKAEELMAKVIDVLVKKAAKFKVTVEGHTDDSPMKSTTIPSNWELSSARASTVVRLFEEKGFPHDRLRPVGLADIEPVAANRDPQGKAIPDNQAQNRRIVIRVLRELPKRIEKKVAEKTAVPPAGGTPPSG